MPPKRNPIIERDLQDRLKWARSLPVGRFEGKIGAFYWIGPDNFHYVPDRTAPFAFIRASGERIQPDEFDTDMGSVVAILSMASSGGYVSRTSHLPGWLPHDWEFDQHHAAKSDKSFEDVNLTLAEAMVTMMDLGMCRRSYHDVINVHHGVSSVFGLRMWNGKRIAR
jgi:hypothetical protein